MGEIQRRDPRTIQPPGPAGAIARTTSSVEVVGRSVTDITWDGAVLDLDAAGLQAWTTGPVAPLASSVQDEHGARRRPDGTYYRLRAGWVALPGEVIVHRLEQTLVRGADGKLHTHGGYVLTDQTHYPSAGTPTRRTGQVPADPPSAPGATSTGGVAETDSGLRKRFQKGFTALELLPAPVRRSVTQRLRDPLVFTGEALRYDDGDRYQVDVLAITTTGAIAVHATTHRDTTAWQVEQYVYTWPAGTPITSSAGAAVVGPDGRGGSDGR